MGDEDTYRVAWVDWLKAFSIFLIVWSHRELPQGVLFYMWSFHVPAFFFVSGFLNRRENVELNFINYTSRFFRSLIVPYFCLGIFAWILWAAKLQFHPGKGYGYDVSLWRPIVGMLYGTSTDISLMRHSLELWFFPALFSAHMLHYFFRRITHTDYGYFLLITLCCLIGFCSWSTLPVRLPWSFESALTAMVFYGIGNIFFSISTSQTKFYQIKSISSCCVLFILHIYGVYLIGGRTDIREGLFYNPYCFVVTAVAGIFFWIALFSKMRTNRVILFISRNTLPIFVFQTTFGLVVSTVRFFVFQLPNDEWMSTFWGGLIYSILAVVILSSCGEMCRKIAPWLIGERTSSELANTPKGIGVF